MSRLNSKFKPCSFSHHTALIVHIPKVLKCLGYSKPKASGTAQPPPTAAPAPASRGAGAQSGPLVARPPQSQQQELLGLQRQAQQKAEQAERQLFTQQQINNQLNKQLQEEKQRVDSSAVQK